MTEILTADPGSDGDDQFANVVPDPDYLARNLLGMAAAAPLSLSPNEKRDARRLIAKFLRLSEQYKNRISYSQARPFKVMVYPDQGYRGDCSSYVTQAFAYAWDILDGVPLHDPNGRVEYDGYGWTGTLLATNHGHRVPLDRRFFVGDLAIFGSFFNTKHVTVCRKGGMEADAVFSSHGTEAGPLPTRLRYRPDLVGVYRPVSLL